MPTPMRRERCQALDDAEERCRSTKTRRITFHGSTAFFLEDERWPEAVVTWLCEKHRSVD